MNRMFRKLANNKQICSRCGSRPIVDEADRQASLCFYCRHLLNFELRQWKDEGKMLAGGRPF